MMFKGPIRTLLLLVAGVALIASSAASPAVLPTPAKPTAIATANGGELQVSWQPVSGAEFYTVGWINRNDYNGLLASGGDWLSAFHYATVMASNTSYTVSGLKPGEEYWTIVGARASRVGGDDPSWSSWSDMVTTAGQHGEGFCPITGLPLPPGGYSSVGDANYFGSRSGAHIRVTLESATTTKSVSTTSGSDYEASSGLKLLRLCVNVANAAGVDVYFQPGTHNNLATDVGIGFVRVLGWGDVPVRDGFQVTNCDTWTIPETATTAVYAIGYPKTGGIPGETLYEIDVSGD